MQRQGWWATEALAKQWVILQKKSNKNWIVSEVEYEKQMENKEILPFWKSLEIPLLFAIPLYWALCWLWTVYIKDYTYYWFLGHINLGIHEVGHIVFGIFGNQTIHVLWWTLLQLLFPIIFMGIARYRKQAFALVLCGVWLATNFFYVARYMYDATRLVLPMLSMSWDSETSIHDRNYLFGLWWVIAQTDQIAFFTRIIWFILYGIALLYWLFLIVKAIEMQQKK
jgi:hypothetical protein